MRELALALGAALAAVLLLLLGLWLVGQPPLSVLATGWQGAAGSWARIAITAQEAVPLLICGLGAALAFRCGVLNIGLEGQYLVGAVTAVAVLTTAQGGWPLVLVALVAGAVAGALWVGLAIGLDRWRGVPLVLSTILLNTIAAQLCGVLVQGPLQDPATGAPQTPVITDANRLPLLFDGTSLHLGAVLAVVLAIVSWLVQTRTPLGFELTVAGLNPLAARYAGIPVTARQLLAGFASGALAGLAGAVQVAGVTFFLALDPRSSGYAGIAVALLGRLHPLGVIAAALFFAGLDVGSRQLERRMGIPHDLGDVAKGLAVVLVLLLGRLAAWRKP